VQQGKAGHRLHIPVGNDQTVVPSAQFGECGRSAICIVNLLKTKLLEQVMRDANHRAVVVHDQNRLGQIDSHDAYARTKLSPKGGDKYQQALNNPLI